MTGDYYRKAFTSNDLPNLYTAFFYFKKCDIVAEIFHMVEIIFKNWQRFFHLYLKENKPDRLSGDVAFALAVKILGYEDKVSNSFMSDVATFTHMKSHIQNVPAALLSEQWFKSLPTFWSDHSNFKIGNFQQIYPFHYVEKEWLKPEWVREMEMKSGI